MNKKKIENESLKVRPISSLKFRILTGVIGLVLLPGIVAIVIARGRLGSALEKELVERGVAITRTVAVRSTKPVLTTDLFTLHELIRNIIDSNKDVRYVIIYYPEEQILIHSFKKGIPKGLLEANYIPEGKEFHHVLLETEEGSIRDVIVPLWDKGKGVVRVGMSERRINHLLSGVTYQMIGVIGLVLLLGISGAYILTTILTRRLFNLVDMAAAVGKGDLDAKAPQESNDEVGSLTSAFNSMVEDLKRHITEQKKMQSQLFHSGKLAAMGELASCVAHEINNPLSSIAVCAESLLERLSQGALNCCLSEREEWTEYLKSIEKEIHRCKKITTALLSLSNLKEPQIALIDINQLLENMLLLVKYQADRTGKKIIIKLGSELPLVLADGDSLQQVFLNLMINALDHTNGGGKIDISTRITRREDKPWVEVVLADNGCGIPRENLDKIFQPFFTTKKDGTGSGLGLSISKRIVEEHNGQIVVTSQLNKGSVFSVYLPLEKD